MIQPLFPDQSSILLDDLGYHAGTNGTAAFTNREAQTIFHGDRSDQGNSHFHVVIRHYHFYAFRQFARTGHVSGPEVELRTVALEERSMTTTFFFGQYVHFTQIGRASCRERVEISVGAV